jgi:hypothetical protein
MLTAYVSSPEEFQKHTDEYEKLENWQRFRV